MDGLGIFTCKLKTSCIILLIVINISDFDLITNSIQIAKKIKQIDKCFVSTDSKKIAEI